MLPQWAQTYLYKSVGRSVLHPLMHRWWKEGNSYNEQFKRGDFLSEQIQHLLQSYTSPCFIQMKKQVFFCAYIREIKESNIITDSIQTLLDRVGCFELRDEITAAEHVWLAANVDQNTLIEMPATQALGIKSNFFLTWTLFFFSVFVESAPSFRKEGIQQFRNTWFKL